MNAKAVGAISGASGGALLGALTGWLIGHGDGAAVGALVGGAALGFVGYTTTSAVTSAGTGTSGLPWSRKPQVAPQFVRARGISQISPGF